MTGEAAPPEKRRAAGPFPRHVPGVREGRRYTHRPGAQRTFEITARVGGRNSHHRVVHVEHRRVTNRKALDEINAIACMGKAWTGRYWISVTTREITHIPTNQRSTTFHRYSKLIREESRKWTCK